jgi:hypothetical protein
LAGALLFDEKIRQRCCTILVWIAGCWSFSNILLRSRNPKDNDSSVFFGQGSAEKITVCAHTNLHPSKQEVGFIFVWSGLER